MNSFIRLAPEDVTKYWEYIKSTVVDETLSPEAKGSAQTNILKSLMAGYMECWILTDEQNVKAVLTTLVTQEPTGQKFLFISSLHVMKGVTEEMVECLIDSLKTLARGRKCSSVIHFTRNKVTARIVKHFGGDTDVMMLRLEV